jgi:hypothetical protein
MPTHDASSTGEGLGTSLTISHTVAGSDGLLLLSIETYRAADGGYAPTSVTYNGAAMTKIYDGLFGNGDKERHTVYMLVAPDTGTHDLVMTWAANQADIAVAADSYTDVDQATAVGTPVADTTDNTTSYSVVVADGDTGDTIWATCANYATAGDPTLGTGQSQRAWNSNGDAADSVYNSDKAGAASVTMTYTWGSAEYASLVAFAVYAPAAAGRSTHPPFPQRLGTHVRM